MQQYLPFTVLKLAIALYTSSQSSTLQQYLPFTVLKPLAGVKPSLIAFSCNSTYRLRYWNAFRELIKKYTFSVATVLTVYGIETDKHNFSSFTEMNDKLQQHLPFTVLKLEIFSLNSEEYNVATVLTVYGIETMEVKSLRRFYLITLQ